MDLRRLLCCCLLIAACGAPDTTEAGLTYLGQFRVPRGATFAGTLIGGLSGISYDPQNNRYFVISDDRSAKNPARFYTVQMSLSDRGIRDLQFTATHPLLNRDGKPFGALDTTMRPPVVPPDSEGIAVDSRRERLFWSSEGERLTDVPGGPVLLDPWIRIAGLDGDFLGEIPLPPGLKMSAGGAGPRKNHGLEGLALTPSGASLWAAMEVPGYNDGEPATEGRGALTRLTKFDADTGAVAGQYAYPLDPVSSGKGGDNGLSDLVALDDDSFLVVERGFGTHAVARVFRAEVGDAEDISARASLNPAPVRTMAKALLADLSTMAGVSPPDNIEGITLGPMLSDGRQSVVMVSDDNFSPRQITQFLVFAM
jgi:hypothetical protein